MYILVLVKLLALFSEYMVLAGYFRFGKAYYWHDRVQGVVNLALGLWVICFLGGPLLGGA